MNTDSIYTTLLTQPRSIDGKTWHGFSYRISRDESGKVEVTEHGARTSLTIYEADGPELDALDEATVKGMIEAALPVDESYVIPPPPTPYVETFTAEDWITSQGYTATRLVSLLDVEAKLNATQRVSPKAAAVRGWLDTVLATYAQDPSPRGDWPASPHTYEATIQEAVYILAQP